MILYRILLGIDLITLAVVLYFFLWGLSDGTVSDFNIGEWMLLLGLAIAPPVLGVMLRRAGRSWAAAAVLAVPATPALLYALFVLVLVLTNPRWN